MMTNAFTNTFLHDYQLSHDHFFLSVSVVLLSLTLSTHRPRRTGHWSQVREERLFFGVVWNGSEPQILRTGIGLSLGSHVTSHVTLVHSLAPPLPLYTLLLLYVHNVILVVFLRFWPESYHWSETAPSQLPVEHVILYRNPHRIEEDNVLQLRGIIISSR